ncbi:glucosamine--fructose-6-phosphate aminotransferase (isomerizing) [Thermosulfidibacter takaii ABI70S6]|uniref:Glutamine--fructose-6-phosphate aminotransferase [isomerizing] n=1 Tax=Thermosulfidibacter takaii (strain DSM 17441 / JCM 13301 / NBRC 103674 / ABI70S6) TaxID=1298851 RepID=A0A0S3QTY0_THET7|nr:glutamine--fructose-6-phosphate transaminase (isomerizing) [Thermosulfidibacter takaii]BAT71765.1 glucosamine--fructose-6-phosphate aminotransferase (isomerizing) [Thermosulfidibacter takaii ABI70S6]
MCGIVGYLGNRNAIEIILDALKRLEYRGYDSAGVAVFDGKKIGIVKRKGKIRDLENAIRGLELSGTVGIGHTRWATHGKPDDINAHPHRCGPIVLVHNGIIENYLELKEMLQQGNGNSFYSETDTEVVACLIASNYKGNLLKAVLESVKQLKGSYALVVMSEQEPDKLMVYRKDSPLILGVGENEFFVASDIPAILPYTNRIIALEDDECAVIERSGFKIFKEGGVVVKEPKVINWTPALAEKAGYKHFMQKEIFEQPRAIADTISAYYSADGNFGLFQAPFIKKLEQVKRVRLVACGTSYHACLVSRYWFDRFTTLPVEVDIASEFRYRDLVIEPEDLCIFVSQSGETADTLAALRICNKANAVTVGICNVMESTIARESQSVVYTMAGPEIGVASTKAFTTQLVVLFLISVYLGYLQGTLPHEEVVTLCDPLLYVPGLVEETLKLNYILKSLANKFMKTEHFLYLGRYLNYPIALEGALKLKEISYIHAEGYAAGEMKHGPIALIDENMPVVVLAPVDKVYEKIRSNIEEVKSRSGIVIAFTDKGNQELEGKCDHVFYLPKTEEYLTPFLYVIPLQLFAYHVAALKGCDVDQPRNLAKAVTVE